MGGRLAGFDNHPLVAWARHLPPGWSTRVATCGPLGGWWPSPGTHGSLLGLVVYAAVFLPLPMWLQVVGGLLLGYLAIVFCHQGARELNQIDPPRVILDEVVGMVWACIGWISLTGAVPLWPALIASFGLFRVLDILKPLGIRRLQSLPGGLGVVIDDLVAGLVTAVLLGGLARLADAV